MAQNGRRDHSESGSLLIFVGGILGLIFPVFPLTLTLLLPSDVGEWFETVGVWITGSGSALTIPRLPAFIEFFVAVGALATIAFGVIAISAYTWVKRGRVREGGLVAIMAGVAMIAGLHWIPGIITAIGGALCYNSPEQANKRGVAYPSR
jgi:branched-subunit amino acid permease